MTTTKNVTLNKFEILISFFANLICKVCANKRVLTFTWNKQHSKSSLFKTYYLVNWKRFKFYYHFIDKNLGVIITERFSILDISLKSYFISLHVNDSYKLRSLLSCPITKNSKKMLVTIWYDKYRCCLLKGVVNLCSLIKSYHSFCFPKHH